jgi:hypothetical protein
MRKTQHQGVFGKAHRTLRCIIHVATFPIDKTNDTLGVNGKTSQVVTA